MLFNKVLDCVCCLDMTENNAGFPVRTCWHGDTFRCFLTRHKVQKKILLKMYTNLTKSVKLFLKGTGQLHHVI